MVLLVLFSEHGDGGRNVTDAPDAVRVSTADDRAQSGTVGFLLVVGSAAFAVAAAVAGAGLLSILVGVAVAFVMLAMLVVLEAVGERESA